MDNQPMVLLEHIREYHFRACLGCMKQLKHFKQRGELLQMAIMGNQALFHVGAATTLNKTIGDEHDLMSNDLWQEVLATIKLLEN